MPVHVSIHDVSPASRALVDRALRLCDEYDARPSLLVVPHWHGTYALAGDPGLCRELRERQAAGHEIFLHGLLHRGTTLPRAGLVPGLRHALAQRVISSGEAEMAGIEEREGRERVLLGEEALRDLGLRVDGYVAPAWALPRWLLRVLAVRGYRYTEDHLRIHDPAGGRARASVVINWATRSRSRRIASIGWCRAVRPARALVPLRIAIHPNDLGDARVEREVRRALAWAAGDFVDRSADLFEARRSGPPTEGQ